MEVYEVGDELVLVEDGAEYLWFRILSLSENETDFRGVVTKVSEQAASHSWTIKKQFWVSVKSHLRRVRSSRTVRFEREDVV